MEITYYSLVEAIKEYEVYKSESVTEKIYFVC